MIIYNVTTKVSWTIHDKWLQWTKDEHIPAMLKTGCFSETRLLRLLETDEDEGPTYAVQYYAADLDHYQTYLRFHASILRKQSTQKWGDQLIAFRSLMEVLH